MKNKRVLVVGLGKSGLAAARFLKTLGARVTVSDARPAMLIAELSELLEQGFSVEAGSHGLLTFRRQDLIVVSPGVPMSTPELKQVRAMGAHIIGELELGFEYLKGEVIGVTGSNGKTTTTTLIGEILKAAGRPTLVGGNIGRPVTAMVEESTAESWSVLEVSSFQLETIQTFRPKVAVVLNVTPDHLDRHRTFEAYTDAKARIFENQQTSDFTVLNADDSTCVAMATRTRAQVYWFSRQKEVQQGTWVRDGNILFREVAGQHSSAQSAAGQREVMPVSEIPLKGAHNLENVLAAVCAGVLMGCAPGKIRQAVREFKAVEHRLEFVASIGGVDYYNDSKATNVDATIKALESFPANIHLILGGKDKNSDYTELSDLLRERCKIVYTIGSAAEKIERQLAGVVKIVSAGTLDEAVQKAAQDAMAGDVVLLAPACSSFDQFENYEQRGRIFKELVRRLTETESNPKITSA